MRVQPWVSVSRFDFEPEGRNSRSPCAYSHGSMFPDSILSPKGDILVAHARRAMGTDACPDLVFLEPEGRHSGVSGIQSLPALQKHKNGALRAHTSYLACPRAYAAGLREFRPSGWSRKIRS